MRIAAIHALLVGAMFFINPMDVSAQGRRGAGHYRGGNYGNHSAYHNNHNYYHNAEEYREHHGYNNFRSFYYPYYHSYQYNYLPYYRYNYRYTPYYGGLYGGLYNGLYGSYYYYTPRYNYVPPISYVYPTEGDSGVITQAGYSVADTSHEALVTVHLPNPDAQLWMQGKEMTTMKGDERMFYSPPLELNTDYTYTIKAKWMENGKAVEQKRDVLVKAGQHVSVDFRTPATKEETPPRKLPTPEKKPPVKAPGK